MESTSYTNADLLQEIKADFPGFDKEEILDYTKFVIPNMHFFLKQGKNEQLKKYCTEEILNKILNNKEIFRISPDIDTARVGYARIQGYKNENEEIYIKVYTSIFFYDDIENNEIIDEKYNFDKYWNDIWEITFEGNFGKDIITTCPFCKSQMKYNHSKHMYTCENCKDSLYYSQIKWKIADIEVNKVTYK